MENTLKNYKHGGRRESVLKAGTIAFRNTSIGCFVLNISAGGAGLVVDSSIQLPVTFDLRIDGGPIHRCCLVWRIEDQMGVAFDFDPANRARGLEWSK